MEPFIGQIIMFAGNFAPRGWAFCDGQLLPIAQHSALFSIVGTYYGGDGRNTFALPDLRGRVPVHPGHGPGLLNHTIGEKGGAESVALNTNELPAHTHRSTGTIRANSAQSNNNNPENAFLSTLSGGIKGYSDVANTNMNAGSVIVSTSKVGGSKPHTNMQPFQCVNFIIALQGIYPPRS